MSQKLVVVYVYLICLISEIYAVDRTQFSNLFATERHDSYLSFASSLQFPLSLKYNVTTPCSFDSPILNIAFTNHMLYCLGDDMWDLQPYKNESLQAYKVNDGSSMWVSHIHPNSNLGNRSAFDGVVSIPPYYISVLDDVTGDLFILNSTSGSILNTVSIYSGCQNHGICMASGMTSSIDHKSIFIHYSLPNDTRHGYLFAFDLESNKSTTTEIMEPPSNIANSPTICNDDIIITFNGYSDVRAFSIDSNGDLKQLWNYKFNVDYAVPRNPAVCIPRTDGSFNVLINSELLVDTNDQEEYLLLDGERGTLLKQFVWDPDTTNMPSINTDKMIMIRTTQPSGTPKNIILGYDISDAHGDWRQIYRKETQEGNPYSNILMINDNMFLSGSKTVDIYSIDDGKLIDSLPIPGIGIRQIVAGLDENNKPIVILVSMQKIQPPYIETLL